MAEAALHVQLKLGYKKYMLKTTGTLSRHLKYHVLQSLQYLGNPARKDN
jgi:hypothetical protein